LRKGVIARTSWQSDRIENILITADNILAALQTRPISSPMQTMRRTIWQPVLWLALILLAFVVAAPASADCETPPSSSAAHSCCATHPKTCACAPAHGKASSAKGHQDDCPMATCPCRVMPAAPIAPSLLTTQLFFDIAPVGLTSVALMLPTVRGPTVAQTSAPLRFSSLCSSSPRAPPFQG